MYLSLLLIVLVIASAAYLLRQYWRHELEASDGGEASALVSESDYVERRAA